MITIEVIYALPEQQRGVELSVASGTTAREAAVQARLERYFTALNSREQALGVWGRVVSDDYVLCANDRVEIYRELAISPREQRRRRDAGAKESGRPRV